MKFPAPHSEVKEILNHITSGKALDLGCGKGRNSLHLSQNGFTVTARDVSKASITHLQNIIESENLSETINAATYNAEDAAITDNYDLITCTVVLQFLKADTIPNIIKNMQEHTNEQGINLIVAPISCEDLPCPIDFPFTLKEGELKDYYKDWTILKYNEDLGEFHRTDENGNRYQCKFATLIAQKN